MKTKYLNIEKLAGFVEEISLIELNNEEVHFLPRGTFEVFGIISGNISHKPHQNEDWENISGLQIGGLHYYSYKMKSEGKSTYLSIQFKPGAFRFFTPHPLSLYKNYCEKLMDWETARNNEWEEIVDFLEESLLPTHYRSRKSHITKRALQLISEDLANVTVKTVCDKINISNSYLRELFNRDVGTSPKNFILSRKIHGITNQLINKKRSITELSYEYGFFDNSHFTRSFKNITMVSPRDYLQEYNQRFIQV